MSHNSDSDKSAPGSSSLLSSGDEALPRYHKRAFAHNYHAPFIYHIILKKKDGVGNFGEVKGDARIAPGQPGCAYIERSDSGQNIARAIFRIGKQFPILQIYQYMIMPDHVHLLLRVRDWSDHHLDYYIDCFVNESGVESFQPGYCDKPLLLRRSLSGLYRYIRENPHRLAMRKQFPQFFQRVRNLRIGDRDYEAYGNLFMFRNPDKEAVKINRRFSPEEKRLKRESWLSAAAKGSILVSPFISAEEKAIRAEAESIGAKIILIIHEAFTERYKPSAHDFDLCTRGRLLIISLGLPASTTLSRPLCLRMNSLAEAITKLDLAVGNNIG